MSNEASGSNPPRTSLEEEQLQYKKQLPETFAGADITQQMLLILGCSARKSLTAEQVWSALDIATRVDYERGKASEDQNPPRDFALDSLAALGYISFVDMEDPSSEERIQLTGLGREKFLSIVEKPDYERTNEELFSVG